MSARILVIDDDETLLKSLRKILRLQDYSVDALSNPSQVAALLASRATDCILLDVRMPGVSGLDLLGMILKKCPTTPVIMISGQSNIATAVQSLKDGAYDFIEKPIEPERLLVAVKNAVHSKSLQEEKDTLLRELREQYQMIGESLVMREVFQRISDVAGTAAKVLILGESGTGKELVAWAIHHNSERKAKSYVKLNCAAIPAELLESEIFGHLKGSFTGALSERKGKFTAADGGTLFLDEIGDMSIHLQAKLLRVLDNNEVEVLGENFPRQVDVRIVAATNHVLEKMVEEGTFREDLYHRLNVVKISIPPLRDRPEDILPLALHFLREFSGIYNKRIVSIKRQAAAVLGHYQWPGNVRELRNVMEKLVIFSSSNEVGIRGLQRALESSSQIPNGFDPVDEIIPLRNANQRSEKEYILQCLNKFDWKINDTAAALEIDRSNLFKKMRRYDIYKSK